MSDGTLPPADGRSYQTSTTADPYQWPPMHSTMPIVYWSGPPHPGGVTSGQRVCVEGPRAHVELGGTAGARQVPRVAPARSAGAAARRASAAAAAPAAAAAGSAGSAGSAPAAAGGPAGPADPAGPPAQRAGGAAAAPGATGASARGSAAAATARRAPE